MATSSLSFVASQVCVWPANIKTRHCWQGGLRFDREMNGVSVPYQVVLCSSRNIPSAFTTTHESTKVSFQLMPCGEIKERSVAQNVDKSQMRRHALQVTGADVLLIQ